MDTDIQTMHVLTIPCECGMMVKEIGERPQKREESMRMMKKGKRFNEKLIEVLRGTLPDKMKIESVEMELNYLMEVITEDLKSELGLERTLSLLEVLKTPYLLKYPRWEDLVDGRIEEIKEEYGLEEVA